MSEIKTNVIKSQPPRPGDVSDMADFVRKWGGLPSGSFIQELSELSNLFVDPTHIVPGSFVKWLFDLPVHPSTMPAEFVAALVFTHARSVNYLGHGRKRLQALPQIRRDQHHEKRIR